MINNTPDIKEEMILLILKTALRHGGTDIHFAPGDQPRFRIDRKLVPSKFPSLTMHSCDIILEYFLKQLNSSRQIENIKNNLEKKGSADFNLSFQGFSRFRVNCFKQRGSHAFAIRTIPNKIPTLDELGLPVILKEIFQRDRGLFIITGPAGSGKSTTMAAGIDYMNNVRQDNIITLEDPIEYLHQHNKCLIRQREIPADCENFSYGLKSALRQDPDIIVIGEMRDSETATIAANAAETGHLILTTLHTPTVTEAVDRMIALAPVESREQMRQQIANTLVGVIAQKLLPRCGGGKCLATELLTVTPAMQTAIRENNTYMFKDMIDNKNREDMYTMDFSLEKLVKNGMIESKYLEQHRADMDKKYFGISSNYNSARPATKEERLLQGKYY